MRKFDAFTSVPGAICSLGALGAANIEDAKEGGRRVAGRRAGGWEALGGGLGGTWARPGGVLEGGSGSREEARGGA